MIIQVRVVLKKTVVFVGAHQSENLTNNEINY